MKRYSKRVVFEIESTGFSRDEFEDAVESFFDHVTEVADSNFEDFDIFAGATSVMGNYDD